MSGAPLRVAVTPVRLSLNVTVISVLYVLLFVKPEYCGGILSMVKVAELLFPALSMTSNV